MSPAPDLRLVTSGEDPAGGGRDAGAALPLDDVFRRYAPYVAAVALRILGRSEEIEDLVQDVFLEAARGLRTLRNPGAAKAWLATVTVRLARRRLAARRLRRILGLDRDHDYTLVADMAPSPEERTLLAAVYRALDALPTGERLAWTLRHLEGHRVDAVAKLGGWSYATTKRRIAAAEQRLREVLDVG